MIVKDELTPALVEYIVCEVLVEGLPMIALLGVLNRDGLGNEVEGILASFSNCRGSIARPREDDGNSGARLERLSDNAVDVNRTEFVFV